MVDESRLKTKWLMKLCTAELNQSTFGLMTKYMTISCTASLLQWKRFCFCLTLMAVITGLLVLLVELAHQPFGRRSL